MKLKLLALAATAVFAACEAPYRATDTTTVVVAPDGVSRAFVTQYPAASTVVWSHYDAALVPLDWDLTGWTVLDNEDYVVRFNMDNEDYYAWYDSDGTWIGTAYVMKDHSTMPSVVSTTVTEKFPGYTISSVTREFQADRVAYEVEMKNADTKKKVLIDSNGNIIKEKTKVND